MLQHTKLLCYDAVINNATGVNDMTDEEKQLVDIIRQRGLKAWIGTFGSVVIAQETRSGVKQTSVWLGRKTTIQNLKAIAEAGSI